MRYPTVYLLVISMLSTLAMGSAQAQENNTGPSDEKLMSALVQMKGVANGIEGIENLKAVESLMKFQGYTKIYGNGDGGATPDYSVTSKKNKLSLAEYPYHAPYNASFCKAKNSAGEKFLQEHIEITAEDGFEYAELISNTDTCYESNSTIDIEAELQAVWKEYKEEKTLGFYEKGRRYEAKIAALQEKQGQEREACLSRIKAQDLENLKKNSTCYDLIVTVPVHLRLVDINPTEQHMVLGTELKTQSFCLANMMEYGAYRTTNQGAIACNEFKNQRALSAKNVAEILSYALGMHDSPPQVLQIDGSTKPLKNGLEGLTAEDIKLMNIAIKNFPAASIAPEEPSQEESAINEVKSAE